MRKQLLTVFIAFLFMSKWLVAQQQYHLSSYYLVPFALNPAVAGSDDQIQFSLINKQINTNGNYNSSVSHFGLHMPVNYDRIGLGFQVRNASSLLENHTKMVVAGSYKIHLINGYLSFGLGGGLSTYKVDLSQVSIKDFDDPNLEVSSKTLLSPEIWTGVFYKNQKSKVGFAINQLDKSAVDLNEGFLSKDVHYHLTAERKFSATSSIELIPDVILRYVKGSPLFHQVNLITKFDQKFWLGVGHQTHLVNAQAGTNLAKLTRIVRNELNIAYIGSFKVGEEQLPNSLLHEIILSFKILKHKRIEKIQHQKVTNSPKTL